MMQPIGRREPRPIVQRPPAPPPAGLKVSEASYPPLPATAAANAARPEGAPVQARGGSKGGTKVFAVVVGRQPGYYNTYEEVRPLVDGVAGAVYKSFPSREKAEEWAATKRKELEAAAKEAGEAAATAAFRLSRAAHIRARSEASDGRGAGDSGVGEDGDPVSPPRSARDRARAAGAARDGCMVDNDDDGEGSDHGS